MSRGDERKNGEGSKTDIVKQKELPFLTALFFRMERAMGIEPTSRAWEARILPMNYAREDYE